MIKVRKVTNGMEEINRELLVQKQGDVKYFKMAFSYNMHIDCGIHCHRTERSRIYPDSMKDCTL